MFIGNAGVPPAASGPLVTVAGGKTALDVSTASAFCTGAGVLVLPPPSLLSLSSLACGSVFTGAAGILLLKGLNGEFSGALISFFAPIGFGLFFFESSSLISDM